MFDMAEEVGEADYDPPSWHESFEGEEEEDKGDKWHALSRLCCPGLANLREDEN